MLLLGLCHMNDRPSRKHTDVLRHYLPLHGRTIIDVGCGTGGWAKFMAREGARIIGIDFQPAVLQTARQATEGMDAAYAAASGEALPIAAESVDAVVFFNSLHHVPIAAMPHALCEADRVVRPDGLIYVAEPLAQGPYFELVRQVEDETRVRAIAYETLRGVVSDKATLIEVAEYSYDSPYAVKGFEEFAQRIRDAQPERIATIEVLRDELETAFHRTAIVKGDNFCFDQPMRLNLLRRLPRHT